MSFKNNDKLSYVFLRIVTKVSEIDQKTRYYGTDTQLHNAEIHLIKAINENEGIHVTGLAQKLGVTKGAVSQILVKLQKKNMIVKETDPNNLSKLILKLTPKGKIANDNHEKLHQQFNELFYSVTDKYTKQEKELLKDFFDSLENQINNF
ncbi:MAG: MarR family transcriptional regulator [Pleomorphochaeta sp.]